MDESYFERILNENDLETLSLGKHNNSCSGINCKFFSKITVVEVKEAMKKMRVGKSIGSTRILLKFGSVWESD